MHNLKGERLAELGKESAKSYQQLLFGINQMKEWIEYTLKLVRPTAVVPAKVIEFRPQPNKEIST
jgi:hypothetical protein